MNCTDLDVVEGQKVIFKLVIESGFPFIQERGGEAECDFPKGGAYCTYWPQGRVLLEAWALAQGNTMTGHSVRVEDTVNSIVAVMNS